MATLNKAQRKELASIIESLLIAESARTKHRLGAGATTQSPQYWRARHGELAIKLYETFGIELATLSLFQNNEAA